MLVNYSLIDRLLFIHEQLILSNSVNCRIISEKYEVSQRTILRDISFMKNNLDLPIMFCTKRNSYYYTKQMYGSYWKVETLKLFLDKLEQSQKQKYLRFLNAH